MLGQDNLLEHEVRQPLISAPVVHGSGDSQPGEGFGSFALDLGIDPDRPEARDEIFEALDRFDPLVLGQLSAPKWGPSSASLDDSGEVVVEGIEKTKPLALKPAFVRVDALVRVLAEKVERIPLGSQKRLRDFFDTVLKRDTADLCGALAVDFEQGAFDVRSQVLNEEPR